MKIIPTVMPTAKLANISGSTKSREKQAAQINKDFFQYVSNNVKRALNENRHPRISQAEIQNYTQTKYPNMDIEVSKTPSNSKALGSLRQVYLFLENSIKTPLAGFGLRFGFKTEKCGRNSLDLKNYSDINQLFHEHRHLSDYAISPKFSAKDSILTSILQNNPKKQVITDDFYDNYIYDCKIDDIDEFNPMRTRTKNFKAHLTDFLQENDFTSDEKIAILQNWRHAVQTEINSYKDGINYSSDLLKTVNIHRLKKGEHVRLSTTSEESVLNYDSATLKDGNKLAELKKYFTKFKKAARKNAINDTYMYPQKLKILNEALAQEIKSHRAEHSFMLRDLSETMRKWISEEA